MEQVIETDVVLDDIADNLLVVNKQTIETLYKLENGAECVALYVFYYKTAKWQKTNCIKANDEYIKKCLGWGYDKIRKTKSILKENGLITLVQGRKDNKITSWYVRLSYIVPKNEVESNKLEILEVGNPTSSKQEIDALKITIKMLEDNIDMLKKENILLKEKLDKPKSTKENEKNTKHKYGEYGRVLLTDEQYKKLVEEYDKAFIDDVIAKVDAYVESNNNKNCYKNFYAVIKNAINGKWFNIREYTKPKPITTLEDNNPEEQEHITIRAKNYFENLYNTDRDKYYNELGKLQLKNPTLARYVVNQVENGGFEEL